MKVNDIVKATAGKLISGDDPEKDIDLSGISTDSRDVKRGEFFIALKGNNFDGDKFVDQVFQKGGIGAVVSKYEPTAQAKGKIVIKVKNTTEALQGIARRHRESFNIPVVCITGSNGKTTTKEMLWRILSTKYNVLKNEGTKNNHIGVPQTLLKLQKHHQVCVLEIGANHRGEIALLSGIAKPTVAVITNIGPSHLEFFKTLSGVLKAKKELLDFLKKDGIAVLNGDDKLLSKIRKAKFRILKFGTGEGSDFRATRIISQKGRIEFLLNRDKEFELNMLGAHNIYNALAAIAAASLFKVDYESMRRALVSYHADYRRMNLKKVNGIDVIDDSYNSNPLSMKSALEVLRFYPANRRWVVSGDMLELGIESRRFHEAMGEEIARMKADGLITFGKLSKYTHAKAKNSGMDKKSMWHCENHEEIARILRQRAKRGDAILIKGSRSMKMEDVLEKLKGKD